MKYGHPFSRARQRGGASRQPRRLSAGFTIVELLIVVVIIAILAALVIVGYNGLQARARASQVSSGLTQAKKKLELYKVTNNAYPTSGNLAAAGVVDADVSYQYTSDGTAYCLTGTSSTTVYKVTDTTPPATGGCNGHTWQGGVAMTNLVANGDFSNGTTSWGGTTTAYSKTAADNTLTMTALIDGTSADYLYQSTAAGIAGHKYYVAYEMNPFRTHTPLVHIGDAYSNLSKAATAGTFTRGSAMLAATNTACLYMYANGGSNSTGVVTGVQTKFRNVVLIDLTAAFGTGSEPTAAKMDAVMQQFPNNWFSGTVTADTRWII